MLSSSLLAVAALYDIFFARSGSEYVNGESKYGLKARSIALSSAEKLFSNHNYFLDFLKSQSPVIRSAAYSVIRSCLKNIPHAIGEGDMKVLAGTILGSFQEKNPACHSSIWETLLLFTKSFPNSWTSVNVQKIVVNRLLNFLKNGCFGSQQVSYPALVLFLETIPANTINGEKFLIEFFRSLWEGRNLSYSSHADRLAFFLAAEECFVWSLRNASRYGLKWIYVSYLLFVTTHEICIGFGSFFSFFMFWRVNTYFCLHVIRYVDGEDAIYHIQYKLVDEILLGLFWHEYLLSASTKDQDVPFPSYSMGHSNSSIQPIYKESREGVNTKYSRDHDESLGKCIIKIISGIHNIKHELLLIFSSKFQADCVDIFQKTEYSSQKVQKMVKFILLLDGVQEGETWPLLDLVGPTLKKSFPIIGTLVS